MKNPMNNAEEVRVIKATGYFEGNLQRNNITFYPLAVDNGARSGYAKYRFRVDKNYNYELYSIYACGESRPTSLYIDDELKTDDGLKEDTGGWKAQAVGLYREFEVYLKKGEHILKLKRDGCVPHIKEFILVRKGTPVSWFSEEKTRGTEQKDNCFAAQGKLVVPPEIREMVLSEENRQAHPQIMDYTQYKDFDTIGPQCSFEAGRGNDKPVTEKCVYLYGDTSESHRWGANFNENDFFLQLEKLKYYKSQGEDFRAVIGARRTNLFALGKIIKLIAEKTGKTIKTGMPGFQMKPFGNIKARFHEYLDKVNNHTSGQNIEVSIADSGLDRLLEKIEEISQSPFFNENELLRALGPVCKDVFIGPNYILFNLSGLCNADCVYCRKFSPWMQWSVEGEHLQGKQILDLGIVERVLKDAVALKAENILIVGEGEPTVYPDFLKILKMIKKLNLRYNISTNGILLDKYAECLIEDRACDSLTVSMSYASGETFARIRPKTPVKYAAIIEKNVKNLSALKKRRNNNCPEIIALHAINKYNYKEIVDMANKARDIGADAIWYQMVHLSDFSYEKLKLNDTEMEEIRKSLRQARTLCIKNNIKFHSFIDYELEHFNPEKGDWSKQGLLSEGCFVGWHFAFMDLKETISFCCGMKIVGFLDNNKSFKSQWYSDAYRRYRNDGIILHRENPFDLYGKPLYEKFCDSCDNHDQNNMMLALLNKYGLLEFVER